MSAWRSWRYFSPSGESAAGRPRAIVAAPNGALIDQATFPTAAAGLRRARDWIGRRTDGDLDGVLVAAEATALRELAEAS